MKAKKMLTFIFLFVIFAFLVLSAFSGYNIYRDAKTTTVSDFNSLERYPFAMTNNKKDSVSAKPIQKIINGILSIEKNFSSLFEDNNVAVYKIAEIKKEFDKNLYQYNITTSHSGTKHEKNGNRDTVLLHTDGSLSYLIDDNSISSHLTSFVDFANKMKNEERQLLLFIPPDNNQGIDPMYNEVYIDYSDKQEQKIIDACITNNIPYILYSDHIDNNWDRLFFRTDHHWLPYHGIAACKLISQWLNNHGYNCDTDIYNFSNYFITENDNPMIGSLGKKATLVYTAAEHMPIITPQYDSDINVFKSSENLISNGSIENTLLYPEFLTKSDIYKNTQYHYYGNRDQELVEIHNNALHDGKKILLIKNSFANCVYPFMSCMAENVNVIDLRYFKGSLETYISEYDPDTVIVFYTVSTFINYEGKYNLAFDFQ